MVHKLLEHNMSRNSGQRLSLEIPEDNRPHPFTQTRSKMFSNETHTDSTATSSKTPVMSPKGMPEPVIHVFENTQLGLKTYLVVDPVTEEAIIIDPVLDFDTKTKEIKTRSADALIKFIESEGYFVLHILETAIHSNHLSASRYIQFRVNKATGLRPAVVTGASVAASCQLISPDPSWPLQSQDETFDKQLSSHDKLRIGNLVGEVTLVSTQDDREQIAFVVGGHALTSRANLLTSKSADRLQHFSSHLSLNAGSRGESQASSHHDSSYHDAATTPTESSRASKVTFNESESEIIMSTYAKQVNARGGHIPAKVRLASPTESGGSVSIEPMKVPRRLSMLLR